jgi:hypothetical protein
MIITLVLLPLIGILSILILNATYASSLSDKENTTIYMDVGIGTSIITFLLSVII